jgi:septal ring factor EnvC (AmiA/AmiB activator)
MSDKVLEAIERTKYPNYKYIEGEDLWQDLKLITNEVLRLRKAIDRIDRTLARCLEEKIDDERAAEEIVSILKQTKNWKSPLKIVDSEGLTCGVHSLPDYMQEMLKERISRLNGDNENE